MKNPELTVNAARHSNKIDEWCLTPHNKNQLTTFFPKP
jgi:hypothetical protein